uniref:hypothetical protein n=1 Tax=Comamonas testosteroni TaxID=285 RepID=UPI003D17AE21
MSFASSLGALLAFLIARWLAGDFVRQRFAIRQQRRSGYKRMFDDRVTNVRPRASFR